MNNNNKSNQRFIPYESHIDGLRAMAVLAVVLYHLFPALLPSGFVGVDIFFVISGYLISRIIFQSLENNNFSFAEFYIRRIKRIFPTLIMVLLFVCFVGWMILLDYEYVALGKMIRSTTTFVTNLRLFRDVGYFDSAAVEKPLLHLWSLSLEEQYYLFFPLIVFCCYKIRRILLPLLIVLILASFARNVVMIKSDQSASFYFLSARAWELMLGAMLAYYKIFHADLLSQKFNYYAALTAKPALKNLISLLGLAMIIFSMVLFKEPKAFPGWLALLPALGALLLLSVQKTWINHHLLSNRLMVWIGLISYSLYLWHWPLLSFATVLNKGKVGILTLCIIFVSSLLLAALTTFYLERPIRRYGYKIVYALGSVMILLLAFSYIITSQRLSPLVYKTTGSLKNIQSAAKDWPFLETRLSMTDKRKFPFPSYGKGKRVMLFFGDSNIEQYWPRVEKLLDEDPQVKKNYTVVYATYGGQIPTLDSHNAGDEKKTEFINKISAYIDDPSIDSVVIGACWILYFERDEKLAATYFTKLENMLWKLKQQGKPTYLLLNIPTGPQYDPIGMVDRRLMSPWKVNEQKSYDSQEWLTRSERLTKKLVSIANATGAVIINPFDVLCPKGQCILLDDRNTPIYKDATHLTGSYAREHATYIDSIFKAKRPRVGFAASG
jgi:peptidoglycan/LPS O-acetylase OafA/YrhL